MNKRIGYFIPEFPGQTHIFFWREIQVLESMGIQVDIISTQPPAANLMSHTWAKAAQRRTTYLTPPTLCNFLGMGLALVQGGLKSWLTCLQIIQQAKDLSVADKLRLFAFMLVGAEVSYIAKQQQWQHLHVHSCANSANIALFSSLISGLPYSITLHGPLEDYGSNQAQKWSKAKFGIVITQKLYEEVHQLLADNLPEQVAIAPMGVNASVFQRTHPYLPWDKQTNFRIFSCGRLNHCKGHADLIEAIALLRQQGIPATLEIAGEDEQGGTGYRKELESLIQRLNLADSVRLLGATSEETIKTSLENAHIFALASLHEPLGVAIMEAMAMEVPVVVTGSGGVKELIEQGVDGLLVEPQAPPQLADAILKLLVDRQLAQQLGTAGRVKVIQQFHSKRSAETLVNLIWAPSEFDSQEVKVPVGIRSR
ncbi:MAG: glycosyltransferase family 4 protein [Timaviella obliquedivisa GSE-PSE-MK23-08B]|jgi:glycosyltransferase involved in cell wall biosynthesis|nr:glycosyltransferase family 4 protein [Timaviella obliquedivisa GSE-PSE-MK23-08B]